jgi:tRNA 2-thiouridine synthesizing protein B
MILHTVNKSPFQNDSLAGCLLVAKEGCAVLLFEDGDYAATKGTKVSASIEEAMKSVKVYALTPDLETRGVQDRVIDGVELVDYAGFVNLATEYSAVQAWL